MTRSNRWTLSVIRRKRYADKSGDNKIQNYERSSSKSSNSDLPPDWKSENRKIKINFVVGDVQALHSKKENNLACFQAASQFNCLEFISPGEKPESGITRWARDHTQGPACCTCAAPATLVRNILQSSEHQFNNLEDVERYIAHTANAKAKTAENRDDLSGANFPFWSSRSGYTIANKENLSQIPWDKIDSEIIRSKLKIGVHADTEITSKGSWGLEAIQPLTDADGNRSDVRRATQIFCSAISIAYNGRSSTAKDWEKIAKLVLQSAYESTFLAAIENRDRHGGKEGSKKLFLTLLGAGVFGNSEAWVCDAIEAALVKFRHEDLDVQVVCFGGLSPNCKKFKEKLGARNSMDLF